MAEAYLELGGIIITPESLSIERAKATAAIFSRGRLEYASLIECRRRNDGNEEILVVDVDVQRPQFRAHDIRPTERVALVFRKDDGRPDALSLRADFPNVPHLNFTLTEYPKSLCLYEDDWLEVKSRWTPPRFVERVRYWFAQTVRGSLHQEDQPLEPLIAASGYQIVVPHDLFTRDHNHGIQTVRIAIPGGEKSRVLVASRPVKGAEYQGLPFVSVALKAEPQTHGVIRNAPESIFELHGFLKAAGLDLLETLRTSQQLWAEKANRKAKLIIIVACPKTRGKTTSVESTDVWAFMTLKTVEDVLTAIGRVGVVDGVMGHLIGGARENEQGQSIALEVLRTVYSFSPTMGAYLNGRDEPYRQKVVAVGLGAVGSKVQLGLSRTGFGEWTLVDDDALLPHNLARHQSTGFGIGCKKVEIARLETASLCDTEDPPTAIPANVLSPGEHEASLTKAIAEAELILDMSASVRVARHLALMERSNARRLSVFLNPSGTDLVILAEDAERKVTLDALEFQLYRAVLSDKRLENHLTRSTGRVRYSGSCRDVTTRIADSQASILSAIAVRAIPGIIDDEAPQIRVWQLDPDSSNVTSLSILVHDVSMEDFSDWTLVSDHGFEKRLQSLRKAKLPNETGGVLLGHFDHAHHRVYLVDTIPSPPDSEEWPTFFTRGSLTLPKEMERASTLTGGNVEYVGEWHSHPKGYTCQPSADDMKVFAWLTKHMDEEGLPALMTIVGDKGPWFFLGQMIWKGG